MSKEFDKWWKESGRWKESGIEQVSAFEIAPAEKGWNARQPEIDAIKHRFEEANKLTVEWMEKCKELQAENERLRPYVDAFRREEDRADKLDRGLDELRKDAERLNFLDSNRRFIMGWEVGIAPVGCISIRSVINSPQLIREAIDAAMKDFSTT